MADVFLKSIITFFVIYGIVYFVKEIIKFFTLQTGSNNEDLFVVIKAKNSQDTLEMTVRNIIWTFLNKSQGGYIPDILIVDMDSTDETLNIAKKLSQNYNFVYYTTNTLYEKAKVRDDEI